MASDNRSVRIGGNAVGSTIVTGDHNKVSSQVTLPSADSVDIRQELAALRSLIAELGLAAKEQRKIDNALDEAADEVAEDKPDREAVGETLERALKTIERVGKLPQIIELLRPHLERAAAWLALGAAALRPPLAGLRGPPRHRSHHPGPGSGDPRSAE